MKNKISIIVPTYNVEQYLVECMESIVNQTLEDIEIICDTVCEMDKGVLTRLR
jgi:glycosyltransferase involved in cell wall biosynthesis